MNWSKFFAWVSAIAVLAGVLFWLSRPPKPEPGMVQVNHTPPAATPTVAVNVSNLFQWQSQEFTNRGLSTPDGNAAPRPEDQQALELQNMIIQQNLPRR